ncbi:MAG: MBOAT family protein [Clostridia bacterium]|nr:MBOAT family protein [Clostridia bacterium]
MAFNTIEFLLFFFVFFALYYIFPQKARNVLLLAGSLFFYATNSLPLSLYIILAIISTYILGLLIQKNSQSKKACNALLSVGVVALVAALAVFKYTNFFIRGFNSIFSKDVSQFNIIAPLGISFITFSAISYLVDVKREKVIAEKNILKYALFLSFFPKVMQGPIEKASDIIPQFEKEHKFQLIPAREGFVTALFGLFMKMAVADRIAIPVNEIFGSLSEQTGARIIAGVFLFAVQLYADFAGYSLIAIGSSQILGFNIKQNFRQPYFSLSVSEFWRRWHISLNTWLKDYIYIPLGGSRCSKARKYFNVMVTFLVSGFWHGADVGYIIWGGLNGAYVVGENVYRDIRKKKEPAKANAFLNFLMQAKTFILVGFSWLFFRAQTAEDIALSFKQIFTNFGLKNYLDYLINLVVGKSHDALLGYLVTGFCTFIMIVADILITNKKISAGKIAQGNRFLRWIILYALIFMIILLGAYGFGYNASSFIYDRF